MKANQIFLLLFLLPLVIFANRLTQDEGGIVLFDANTTPISEIVKKGGSILKDGQNSLYVKTVIDPSASGIALKGNWNLSKCNRLVIEIENYNKLGWLPVTVSLENTGASLSKRKGIFVERIYVPAGQTKQFTIELPVKVPHPEVAAQFSGMRTDPFGLWGLISDIDLEKVTGISLYVNKPTSEWEWGLKKVTAGLGAPKPLPQWMFLSSDQFFSFIDQYGQFKYKDWPGKTKSDEDLRAAYEAETVDLNSHQGPVNRNKYGGWQNGPQLKATGSFRVEKYKGKWWMVDPEGRLFWSHGVVRVTPSSGVTPLDNREKYFDKLPGEGSPFAEFYETYDELLKPYYVARGIKKTYDFSAANIKRKYGEGWRAKYAEMAHKRLKSWGLNTIANSSDKSICLQDKTPYTDRIELKSPPIEGSNGMWWKFTDPFDPAFRTDLQRQLKERKAELDDPWCLGFFVDNEINWGTTTSLAEWTLQSPPKQAAKIEMINRLRKKYRTIEMLNEAWKSGYKSWGALINSQKMPPAGAGADCHEFSSAITEAYFKNIREEFKKAAPNKLYLGCRFARSNEHALRIGAKYCDVISYNIYSHTLDNFSLPEGLDKPVMIGEFHFGALDRGLFHPGLIKTDSQQDRARCYENYVSSALRHPNIIGTHWHQFSDQATTGRFDGENFQVGFVDVCDRPYPETIAKIREVGYRIYEIRDGAANNNK
ncbi:hypothetical protein [Arcticibacter tournemirensis]